MVPETDGEGVPAAVSQQPMLWHEQFTPGSFNLPCLVRRYRGRLDLGALEWALSELARRHEPLRSTFDLGPVPPRQVVHPFEPRALPVVDLSAMAAPERHREIVRLTQDATGRPFDLAGGPLFDPFLVRLAGDDHLSVIRIHHTVFDDWSVGVFRRELSALYATRSALPDPPTTFSAYSRRERSHLEGDAGDAQREWWRRELDGAPMSVQLPIGGVGTGPGAALRIDLPAPLASAVRGLAPRLGATPFMTVLAAFSVLVARTVGLDDLLLATVVAHRNRREVEGLIGCFTKKVPLRLRVGGAPTFAELVARTRSSLLGALAHQDIAFDEAVQLGVGRPAADHGVVPQVSVVFQAEAPQTAKLALPGVSVSAYDVPPEARAERHFSAGADASGPAWGDGIYLGTFLILSLLEAVDGMALIARGVFDRSACGRFVDGLIALLGELVASPFRPIEAPSAPAAGARLHGFSVDPARIEAALMSCPGVEGASVAVRDGGAPGSKLVASVVVHGEAPTLAELRRALWAARPGAPWPSEVRLLGAASGLAGGEPDAVAVRLAAVWSQARRRTASVDDIYWQDFSFLHALAGARAAGLSITPETVVRCRTPAMLAAAVGRS